MVTTIRLNRKLSRIEDLRIGNRELELRRRWEGPVPDERTCSEFAAECEIEDRALVERLMRFGFTPESLPALSMAPLAAIAWASGQVTSDEKREVLQAILTSELSGSPEALETFLGWLDSRPQRELLALWVEYTRYRQARLRPAIRQANGQRLAELATRVAFASGGFLGFGKVCEAERLVLRIIDSVFNEA